jgi:signal recognition particle subunit SRP72
VIASTVVPTVTSTTTDPEKAPAPVKKVRKSRVPAGVTPGVTPPPDPERWLKKSERSTFGLGKRRKGGSGGASQGVTPLDAATGPTATNTPKSSGVKGRKKK